MCPNFLLEFFFRIFTTMQYVSYVNISGTTRTNDIMKSESL